MRVSAIMALGIPVLAGTPTGRLAGSDLGGVWGHRDLNGVVVAVIATLHLDDEVAARDRTHKVDGLHRRFRPRVAKAPEGLTEAGRKLLRHDDRILGGLGEMCATGNLGPHCLDDGGVQRARRG